MQARRTPTRLNDHRALQQSCVALDQSAACDYPSNCRAEPRTTPHFEVASDVGRSNGGLCFIVPGAIASHLSSAPALERIITERQSPAGYAHYAWQPLRNTDFKSAKLIKLPRYTNQNPLLNDAQPFRRTRDATPTVPGTLILNPFPSPASQYISMYVAILAIFVCNSLCRCLYAIPSGIECSRLPF